MQLILYKTSSGDNVINKIITEPLTMNINLRRGVDIAAPVLRIEYTEGDSPNKYNYCHIPVLERFYFIRNIQNITRNIWELHLECDVLESYKADILASNVRYLRGIRTGDYFNANIDSAVNTSVSIHHSDNGFTGKPTMILTTIGA